MASKTSVCDGSSELKEGTVKLSNSNVGVSLIKSVLCKMERKWSTHGVILIQNSRTKLHGKSRSEKN